MARKKQDKPLVVDENEELPTGGITQPESNGQKMHMVTDEQLQEMIQAAAQAVMEKDFQKKIREHIIESIEIFNVDDVLETAAIVLGDDYWEIIKIASHMRKRETDTTKFDVDNILFALGGYLTPVRQAAGILWNQHGKKWSEVIVERKKKGDTDVVCRAHADIACSEINKQATVFTNLGDSMIEQINILKKVREDLVEAEQNTGIEPGSSVGVAVMQGNAPWRKKSGDMRR